MQPGTCYALLVPADISGFTKFMKLHTITVTHAKQIIVKLLESIVATAAPPLKLIEIEGDAVFFYAACYQDENELGQYLATVKTQIIGFFRSFYQTMLELSGLQLCICEACASVKNLRLKVVLHAGKVAVEHIQAFEKLFGFDVILVHRLLKNSVPAKEYILITEPVYLRLDVIGLLDIWGIRKLSGRFINLPAETGA